jgi:hypothetical protein
MFAAPLLVATLLAGPPPAEADVAYVASMTLYGGEMPAEGTGGCKIYAQPQLLATAGRCATLFAGGTQQITSDDGSKTGEPFGVTSEVTVTPAGPGLVRVVVMASSSDLVDDVPPGSPRRIHLHGRARFSGIVPLDEPFRFGANGVWAEMRISHFSQGRPAQTGPQTQRGEDSTLGKG